MSKLASQVSLTKSEIAFVDPGVSDLDTLLKHLRPEVDAIVLDRVRSAPAQMADVLRGRNSVAAVHDWNGRSRALVISPRMPAKPTC
jgi:hypothetical protein